MMTPDEASRYQTNPSFKKTLNDVDESFTADSDSQAENAIPLIKSYLNQILQTGKPQTIAQVELILKIPQFMATLTSIYSRQIGKEAGPLSSEEIELTQAINSILEQCKADASAFYSMMIESNTAKKITEHWPFDGETVADIASTYSVIACLPRDQLDNWRNSFLFDYQKEILDNVLIQNGSLSTADRFRVLVTQGGNLTDLSDELARLSEADFAFIEQEYLTKYKIELKTDLRDTIPQREQLTAEQTAWFETILSQNGKIFPVDRIRMLVNGNGGKFQDYQNFFANLPVEEWIKLQFDYLSKYGVSLNDAILASVTKNENLDRNHQVLIKHILDEGNGNPQLLDKLRAFILGDGGNFSDFKQLLKDLPPRKRQRLHDDYLRFFESNFENDFLDKVDKAHKLEYMLLLSVSPKDTINDFFMRMSQCAPLLVPEDSDLSLQSILKINKQVARQFNCTYKEIPKPLQEALVEYFSTSIQTALDSNKKYADFVTKVIRTVTSIAAFVAFLPAGVSAILARMFSQEMDRKLVLTAALSTSKTVASSGILASIEEENFDSTPQSLLKNGSLGTLEILLSYPFGMGVLATKTTLALTKSRATERVTLVISEIATLSGNPNEPEHISVRAKAFEVIKALGNYSDQKQMGIWRDQILEALISKNDTISKDLVAMATTITSITNQEVSRQIPDLLTKINAFAPENKVALANARTQAWNILSTKSGMSQEALAEARTKVLQALASKQDPVSIEALKALESIDSFSIVSGTQLSERLKERIDQSIISNIPGAAEAIRQVQSQANQALVNLIIQKIDTQALTIAPSELQSLKAEAFSALNSLSSSGNSGEIVSLRNQLLEVLVKARDPAALVALEIRSILEKQANNSLDLSIFAAFIQKLHQDPELLNAALELLPKQKTEFEEIQAKLISDSPTLPPDLTTPQISAHISNAANQLNAQSQPRSEVLEELQKQASDSIDALAAQKELFRQQMIASVEAIVNEIRTGAKVISQQNRKTAFQLLNSLTQNGLSEEEEAVLRTKILEALAAKEDSTAKATLAAFDELKSLDEHIVERRTSEILALVTKDRKDDLIRIRISILQDRIIAGSTNNHTLRKSALDAILQLPKVVHQKEKLNFLIAIQDKDPVAKAALTIHSSLGEPAKLTIDKVAELENLAPSLRANALSLIELSPQEFDRLISDSFTHLASIEPDLTIQEALNKLIMTYEEMSRIAINSPGLRNAWKQRISSTIDTIVKEIKGGSKLAGSQRKRAFELIEGLPSHGFTQPQADALRTKIVAALAEKEDFSAKLAVSALETSRGIEHEFERVTDIYSALVKDSVEELRQLELSSIRAKILSRAGDPNALRSQAFDTISQMPENVQQFERLKFLAYISDKDPFARAAITANELLSRNPDTSFDLIALAKRRAQFKGQNLEEILQALGRSQKELDSITTKFAEAYSRSLKSLDIAELTESINIITDQVVISAQDRQIATVLQQRLTEAVDTLTKKMSELPSNTSKIASIKNQIDISLQTLRNHIGRIEYARLESVLKRSLTRFDNTIATELAAAKSTAVLESMNATITQIKNFNGKDFVAIREKGLIALKELEGVDAQALITAREQLLEALALKQDRFAINILKRDALRERVANGDFDVLLELEREMKRSLDSGLTNQEAINFLKAESDAIKELQAKVTRMQTAITALEKLTVKSDQALITAAHKEADTALAAMKPHLNETTLTKLQSHLKEEKGKLNPLSPMEQDLTNEIERVQAHIATLQERGEAELEIAAEQRVLQILQESLTLSRKFVP
ncbi:MAG: hypothetical protein SFY67_02100 [Candidatus Melainabacteria bacterium]|nr:hypothetical protein [Candidatus Melainabacteria bacterium]